MWIEFLIIVIFIFNESQNTVEIYDLGSDPSEKINLFEPGLKEEVDKVRDRLANWVQYQDKFIKQVRNLEK